LWCIGAFRDCGGKAPNSQVLNGFDDPRHRKISRREVPPDFRVRKREVKAAAEGSKAVSEGAKAASEAAKQR
jgi:hypothetical protein